MKILFDTSVLVAAIIKSHSSHKFALPWLQKIRNKTDKGIKDNDSVKEYQYSL